LLAVHALKKWGLRFLNTALGSTPNSLTLFGVHKGLAELGGFRNSIIYQPTTSLPPRFTTVRRSTSFGILLSSAPRLLKGGGFLAIAGGIARRNGAVYTSAGELVVSRDCVYEFVPARLLATPPIFRPRISSRNEPVAALSSAGFNYFHWLHDVLPKIHLLRASGRGEIKLFLNILGDVQVETLRLLGIPTEQIINATDHDFIAGSELIVPNFVGRAGTSRTLATHSIGTRREAIVGNTDGFVDVAEWTCEFLRESFLGLSTNPPQSGSRIYISRRDASNRQETKTERLLTEQLSRHGFESVVLTGMKFVDQVSLFRNAEVVLAPHGAGLANLVFCSPGTRVIELFSTYVTDLCAMLSQVVGADYYYLAGRNVRLRRRRADEEPEFDAGELDELFAMAGLS
jgi:hypothetical protein